MADHNNGAKDNNAESSLLRPYWWPDDAAIEDLPDSLKAAMEAIVKPGYEELVVGAPDNLERLAAMSLIHLTNLEVLDQVSLGKDLAAGDKPEDLDDRVAAHLRLVGAKLRAAGFVHRLRKARKG